MKQICQEFNRGEIYNADLSTAFMSVTASVQPVLVLLTDQGVYNSSTVVVIEARHTVRTPLRSTHVVLDDVRGLSGRSVFRLEELHPIDKRRLQGRVGSLTAEQMNKIDAALRAGFYLEDSDYLPVEIDAP